MRALVPALAAALLALLVNVPWIGRGELESEEARRALPAEAMLAAPAGDVAAWIVPRLWGAPYLAKPPLFPWWVALHQIALERSGLNAVLRPPRGEPNWWPQGRVSPYAVRGAAATSAALLAAVVAWIVARVAGPTGAVRGFLAGALVVAAPEMLAKAPLGEIETTLALWCTVAAVGLGANALAPSPARAALGAIGLGLALLAKGPIALVFALAPALTFAAARVGWRSSLYRVGTCGLVGLALFLWWPLAARRVLDDGAALDNWALEIGRGGTGGLAVYLSDRFRLVGGLLAGFAPASLLALATWRAARRGDLARDPVAQFALHALLWGGTVLLLWPGVRPRYGLPLIAAIAILGAARLTAISGARFQRMTALVVAVAATLLPPIAFVLYSRALDPSGSPLPNLAISQWVLLAASFAIGALLIFRARTSSGLGLLVGAVAAFIAARFVQLDVLDRTRLDERRAEAAAHLEQLAPTGLATNLWEHFNDLYYLSVPVRFCADPARDLARAELLLTKPGGVDGSPESDWTAVPLFESPAWNGGVRPSALSNVELWRHTREARPGD